MTSQSVIYAIIIKNWLLSVYYSGHTSRKNFSLFQTKNEIQLKWTPIDLKILS